MNSFISINSIKLPDPTLLQKVCAEQYEIQRACLLKIIEFYEI
jgi:hypothetical protein